MFNRICSNTLRNRIFKLFPKTIKLQRSSKVVTPAAGRQRLQWDNKSRANSTWARFSPLFQDRKNTGGRLRGQAHALSTQLFPSFQGTGCESRSAHNRQSGPRRSGAGTCNHNHNPASLSYLQHVQTSLSLNTGIKLRSALTSNSPWLDCSWGDSTLSPKESLPCSPCFT